MARILLGTGRQSDGFEPVAHADQVYGADLIGPTLIAPPHTTPPAIAVTSVWKPDVGRVTCQKAGVFDVDPEQETSLQETTKNPCPVAPDAPNGIVPEGRSTGPGEAIELSFVHDVDSFCPPDESICSFA